jgi:hypothetical protein
MILTQRPVLAVAILVSSAVLGARPARADDADPWVVEANAGVPHLKSGDLKLIGDAKLGYSSDKLGAVARGSIDYYDTANNAFATDTLHWTAGLDAWWRSGEKSDLLRIEVRVQGSADSYGSTMNPMTPSAGFFHDEDSLMIRSSLLAGVIVMPSDELYVRVLAGGGIQYESFGYVSLNPSDPNLLADSTSFSPRWSGLFVGRWRFLPEWIALRVRAEADYFPITRDNFFLSQGGSASAPSATFTETAYKQADITARAFLDLDVAALAGFVPAVWLGTDAVLISGPSGSNNVIIGVLGLGFVRPLL